MYACVIFNAVFKYTNYSSDTIWFFMDIFTHLQTHTHIKDILKHFILHRKSSLSPSPPISLSQNGLLHYVTIGKHISFFFLIFFPHSRFEWNDQSKTIELFRILLFHFVTYITNPFHYIAEISWRKIPGILSSAKEGKPAIDRFKTGRCVDKIKWHQIRQSDKMTK